MTQASRDRDQAAAAEAADRSQAEYFRCLLADHRAEVENAIAAFTGIAELSGQLRRAENELAAIDRMIVALDRRFPLSGPPAAAVKRRPAESIHPDGRPLISLTRRHRQMKVM